MQEGDPMEKDWDINSIKDTIVSNIDRLSRTIEEIKKTAVGRPTYDRELSTQIGRLKANTFALNDAYLISREHFIDELNMMRSILPDDTDVATSREYFKLGWKCEIEILKSIASK
jgi:hypothetical protein